MLRLLIISAIILCLNIAFTEAAPADIEVGISIVSTDGTAFSEALKSRYIETEMVMKFIMKLQSTVSLTTSDYFHLSTTQDYTSTGLAVSCKQLSVSNLDGSGSVTQDIALTATFSKATPNVLSFGIAQSSSFTNGQIITLQCSGLKSPTTPTSTPTESLYLNDVVSNLASAFPIFDVYPITATVSWSTANSNVAVASSAPSTLDGYSKLSRPADVTSDSHSTLHTGMAVTAIDEGAPEIIDIKTAAIGLDSSLWEFTAVFKTTPGATGYTVQTQFRAYPNGYITDITTCTYSNGTQSLASTFTAAAAGNDNTATLSYEYQSLALESDNLTHKVRCLVTFADVHIPASPTLNNDVVQLVLTSSPTTVVYHMSSLGRIPVYSKSFTAMKVTVSVTNLYISVDIYKLRAIAALFENQSYDVLSDLGTYSEDVMNGITVHVYTHTPTETVKDDITLYNSEATFYLQWVPVGADTTLRNAFAVTSRKKTINDKIAYRLGTGDDVSISFDPTDDVTIASTCLNGRITTGETDVDCGASCGGCEGGKACTTNDDCIQTCENSVCLGNSASNITFGVGMIALVVMMASLMM